MVPSLGSLERWRVALLEVLGMCRNVGPDVAGTVGDNLPQLP